MHLWSVVFDEPGKRTWRTASSPDNWVYRCNYCDLRVESPKGERPEGGLCASAGGPTLEERWLAAQPGCPRCGGRTQGYYGGELLCWLCLVEEQAEQPKPGEGLGCGNHCDYGIQFAAIIFVKALRKAPRGELGTREKRYHWEFTDDDTQTAYEELVREVVSMEKCERCRVEYDEIKAWWSE